MEYVCDLLDHSKAHELSRSHVCLCDSLSSVVVYWTRGAARTISKLRTYLLISLLDNGGCNGGGLTPNTKHQTPSDILQLTMRRSLDLPSTRAIVFSPLFLFLILVLAYLPGGVVLGLSATSSSNSNNIVAVSARLLVLDTLVPGQRLRLTADNVDVPTSFRELCNTCPDPLIVVGRQGLSLHSRGVQVFVEGSGDGDTLTLSLAATGRIVDICDSGLDEGSRWAGRQGTVTFLPFLAEDDLALSPNDANDASDNVNGNITPEQIISASHSLKELFLEWEQLVRTTGRERFPGHLDGVLRDMGAAAAAAAAADLDSMPDTDAPNARALWIAGVMNPTPALGVALEIRPSVLTARSTERRLVLADQGLRDSISRLQRPGPCF